MTQKCSWLLSVTFTVNINNDWTNAYNVGDDLQVIAIVEIGFFLALLLKSIWEQESHFKEIFQRNLSLKHQHVVTDFHTLSVGYRGEGNVK